VPLRMASQIFRLDKNDTGNQPGSHWGSADLSGFVELPGGRKPSNSCKEKVGT
jgi:hypothetical protein